MDTKLSDSTTNTTARSVQTRLDDFVLYPDGPSINNFVEKGLEGVDESKIKMTKEGRLSNISDFETTSFMKDPTTTANSICRG